MATPAKANKLLRGDRTIWMIVIFLSIVSLIEVYSSIGKAAYDHGWDITTTVARHIGIVLGSYALMILICHMRLKLFSKLARIGYLCCLIMMGAMFVIAIYGKMTGTGGGHAATRWLDDIPVIGQFQPSEIAKYVLLIYLARLIAINQDTLKEKDTFKKLMIPVVLIAGLIFPENFSTAALVFLACIVLMYLGGVNRKYLFYTVAIITALVVVFLLLCFKFDIELFRSQTWVNRIDEWLNDDKTAMTQTNMAKIAIASGGIPGQGIGNTVQGRFLNESHTDFIFSVVIEELGFVWAVIIIIAYVWFFIRCMSISKNCTSPFGQLVTAGLGFVIFLQAMINMGVATGYLPVTGQTLPLISYGGTSYVLTCCAIGVIQAVSHKNKIDSLKEQTVDDGNEETELKPDNNTNEDESNN